MNEDEMTFAEPIAGEDLERALARYARVRLDPSPAQVRRARGAVMEAAWRQHLHADPPGELAASAAAAHRPIRIPFSGWGVRRVGTSFAAAIAVGLLVGSSVFAASRAGGPLYESRLAIESLALPAGVDARVAAQVAHADARLGEAVEAALRHDDAATAAALDAYDQTINDLATAEGAAGVTALEAVQFHRTVLIQLAAQSSNDAATGLNRALANSTQVIDRLVGDGTGGGNGAGGVNGTPKGGGNGAGGVNGEPQGGGNGAGGVNGEPQGGGQGGGTGTGTNGVPQGGGHGQGQGGGHGQGPKATQTPAPVATSTPEPPAKTPKPHRTPPSHSDGSDATETPDPTPTNP